MSLSVMYIFSIFHGLNPSQRIHMKFKYSSVDPVQGKKFLHKMFGRNNLRRQKEVKCCFAFQDLQKPIPTCKLYPNYKLHPFLKHNLSMLNFAWLLGCALAVDDKTIGSQGRNMDKMLISYKNEGDGFQADALCDWGYTYLFFLRNECPLNEYSLTGLSPLHAHVFLYF